LWIILDQLVIVPDFGNHIKSQPIIRTTKLYSQAAKQQREKEEMAKITAIQTICLSICTNWMLSARMGFIEIAPSP
jgi:hypothetical protein